MASVRTEGDETPMNPNGLTAMPAVALCGHTLPNGTVLTLAR